MYHTRTRTIRLSFLSLQESTVNALHIVLVAVAELTFGEHIWSSRLACGASQSI